MSLSLIELETRSAKTNVSVKIQEPDLPMVKSSDATSNLQPGCPWYDCWIEEQIQQQPEKTFCLLEESGDGVPMIQNENFLAVWTEIFHSLLRTPSNSIDTIVADLFDKNLLHMNADAKIESKDIPSYARYLVFAIIGWQTMLFRPDNLSYPADYFGIIDETDGFRGHRHTQLFQSDSAYNKPLPTLLLGFGLMLPPRGFQSTSTIALEEKAKGRVAFTSKTFNAHLLTTICDIQIVWTESLACHLEFDSSTNTLYIFKYPSFCISNLHTNRDRGLAKTTLYACAKPANSDALWATTDDIHAFLSEILISYRILFGMETNSRRCFRRCSPFPGGSQGMKDKSLEELCYKKRPQVDVPIIDRDNFDLTRDFPILKDRLAPLLSALSATKPRTLRQLWEDRRDSSAWSAFWIILFIGLSGVLLALIQVILQIVQIALQST